MGYPETTFRIRNIPVGSERYYLCYPERCYAQGYYVKKNEAGEIIEIVSLSFLRVEEEIREYRELSEDNEDHFIWIKQSYPTAEPSSLEIYVYDDEKINFIATDAYLAKVARAKAALAELENNNKDIFVTKEQIIAWLMKHHDLYWLLQHEWNVLAYQSFQKLYFMFQYFADDFQHMAKAQQAVNEYKPFDEDWLYKYDRLYFTALMGWENGYEVFHEDPFILKQETSNIHLVAEGFGALMNYAKLFTKEYHRGTKNEDHYNSL